MIITVIQANSAPSNAEEAEVERFPEDLQDLLELTPKKDVPWRREWLPTPVFWPGGFHGL